MIAYNPKNGYLRVTSFGLDAEIYLGDIPELPDGLIEMVQTMDGIVARKIDKTWKNPFIVLTLHESPKLVRILSSWIDKHDEKLSQFTDQTSEHTKRDLLLRGWNAIN